MQPPERPEGVTTYQPYPSSGQSAGPPAPGPVLSAVKLALDNIDAVLAGRPAPSLVTG